jgi:hypothetical protein
MKTTFGGLLLMPPENQWRKATVRMSTVHRIWSRQ